ncbi:MAG: acetylxylan esterase [Armatimonadetes bacterium]|nr:acetylxylan esterase [Armatimonadota bacterium]
MLTALLSLALAAAKDPLMTTLAAPLPDPLVMLDGTRATTPEQWRDKRRPELLRLFAEDMYGHMPPPPGNLTATLAGQDERYLGGKVTLRELVLHFGPEGTPPVYLLVATPNQRAGPVPAFVGLNFHGNHAVVDAPWVHEAPPSFDQTHPRGSGRNAYPIELITDRGYAVATLFNGDLREDKAGPPSGAQAMYPDCDWATIACWAWGLQRALDYLVTDPAIDPQRVAVVGHSRNGKTALLAAATDERFALAIPVQAGCGGTAPSRGTVGESVERINTAFPHWFCAKFEEYNEHPERLPFDQHELVALCAPRPVLFSNATEDEWANPVGQFEVLQGADPVYRLLGAGGLEAAAMPAEHVLVKSRLGYFIRPGQHSMGLDDWPAFLEFADAWLR